MTGLTAPDRRPPLSVLLGRGLGFFAIWLALIGAAPGDWPLGLVAAAAATWASVELWPAGGGLSLPGLIRFVLRFLPQAVVAGTDVAWRAMAPRVALKPGFVTCRPALVAGMASGASRAVMSLQPGKLPVSADARGGLLVHCLDVEAPVAAEMAADEASFLRILRGGRSLG